jgi:tetratricopeptide (TPR) repeat protein/acyl carrier protein
MAKEEEAASLFLAFESSDDIDAMAKASDNLSTFLAKGEAEVIAATSVASEKLKGKSSKGKPEAKALHGLAVAQAADGKLAEALTSAQEALDIFQSLGLSTLEAYEYSCIASFYLAKNHPRKALYYAQEAFAMASVKQALGVIVKAYIAKGQPDLAIAEATDGLKAFQEKGDVQGSAEAQMLLFVAYQQVGEMEVAVNSLEDAAQAFKELGDGGKECDLLLMAADLHLKEGAYEKAADESLRAMDLVKADGKWMEMVSALKCHVDAKIALGQAKDAANVATEAREACEKAGATKAEGAACLVLCTAHRETRKFDKAATAAKAAQEIAYQEEDEKGEATALSVQADVYMADDKFDKAIRAAEASRRLWKGMQNLPAEANALNVIAQAQVNMQHKKEAMETGGKPEAWEKALKAGKEALKVSRELSAEQNGDLFCATALCTLAEVYLAKKSAGEALEQANEAVALFMEKGEEASAAYAWVLCAQADVIVEDWNQARDDAMEGLEIFKTVGDSRGESYAQSVLDMVEKLAPPPPATMDPQMMAMMMAQQQGGGGGGGAWKVPASAQKMAVAAPAEMPGAPAAAGRKGGGTGALAVSAGLTEDVVIKKVKEIAMGIIGDDEDIEADMPLMQAGITSNTAVVLRDELMGDLPGINLPPTLLFDYPSIQGIADFVVEKAKAL